MHSVDLARLAVSTATVQKLPFLDILYRGEAWGAFRCSEWLDSRGVKRESHYCLRNAKRPWAQAGSNCLRVKGTLPSWRRSHSESQATSCSSPVILQTRVIQRPHVWWLWQPEIKNKLWFFQQPKWSFTKKFTDWEPEHAKPQSGWRDVCFLNDLLILCNPQ